MRFQVGQVSAANEHKVHSPNTIEPYKNRGLGKPLNVGEKSTSILYDTSNCHARISHKHRRHEKLGLQLSFLRYI